MTALADHPTTAFTPPSDTLVDYAALAAVQVSDNPFRHILLPDFVPPDALARVYAGLPKLNRGGSFPPESLTLGPHARALMRELEGPRLRQAIADKFGLDLGDAPSMLTMRLATREKDGQIHTDSAAKRVTALLYLNPPSDKFDQQDGCLRLLRSGTDLEDYAVEVPPTRGTLLVFPNGSATWHGHRTHVGQRHSVQLNYMTNDAKARTELRRHRLSAADKARADCRVARDSRARVFCFFFAKKKTLPCLPTTAVLHCPSRKKPRGTRP